MLVTADSYSTKKYLDGETMSTIVIAGHARVREKTFMVVDHAVRTSRVHSAEQAESIFDLEAQNPSWKGEVKSLRIA